MKFRNFSNSQKLKLVNDISGKVNSTAIKSLTRLSTWELI